MLVTRHVQDGVKPWLHGLLMLCVRWYDVDLVETRQCFKSAICVMILLWSNCARSRLLARQSYGCSCRAVARVLRFCESSSLRTPSWRFWSVSCRLSSWQLAQHYNRYLIDPVWLMQSLQRLSHACLSTCSLPTKPRMAHYNSYDSIDHDTFLNG